MIKVDAVEVAVPEFDTVAIVIVAVADSILFVSGSKLVTIKPFQFKIVFLFILALS